MLFFVLWSAIAADFRKLQIIHKMPKYQVAILSLSGRRGFFWKVQIATIHFEYLYSLSIVKIATVHPKKQSQGWDQKIPLCLLYLAYWDWKVNVSGGDTNSNSSRLSHLFYQHEGSYSFKNILLLLTGLLHTCYFPSNTVIPCRLLKQQELYTTGGLTWLEWTGGSFILRNKISKQKNSKRRKV